MKTVRYKIKLDKLNTPKGTISLLFEAGKYNRIAVKIVDDRGIESLKVINL